MNPADFPRLLGLTNTDDALIQAVVAHAEGDASLSPAKLQKLRADFVMLEALGVVFAFASREQFQREYGEPRGPGPRVLSGVFYYPEGSDEVEPYEGPAPLLEVAVVDREEALAAYGEPEATEEDSGVVEWDQWSLGGIELGVDYDEDEVVLSLTATLPLLI